MTGILNGYEKILNITCSMRIVNVLEKTMITLADMKNKIDSVFNGFCDFVKCELHAL